MRTGSINAGGGAVAAEVEETDTVGHIAQALHKGGPVLGIALGEVGEVQHGQCGMGGGIGGGHGGGSLGKVVQNEGNAAQRARWQDLQTALSAGAVLPARLACPTKLFKEPSAKNAATEVPVAVLLYSF